MHSNEAFRKYTVGVDQDGRVQFREVPNAPAACRYRAASGHAVVYGDARVAAEAPRDPAPADYLGHGADGGVCVHSQGDHYPLLVMWVERAPAPHRPSVGWWKVFSPGGTLLWVSNGAFLSATHARLAHAVAERMAADYR